MSTSTRQETVRAVKFVAVLLVLFVVMRYGLVPNLEPWFGSMAYFLKLMGVALAAAIVAEMVAEKLT